jgi:DNA-binding MarR family transcriptional regulator
MASDDSVAVLTSVWRLFHALEVRSKRMQRTLGVTGPQRLVIRIVGERPGATAGEIARALSIHASTLTGILDRLEAAGLIRRYADPGDGRRSFVRLTPRGRKIYARKHGTVEASVLRVLAKTPPATLAHFQRMVARLVEDLGADD